MRTLEEISKELYHSLTGLTLPMNLEALRHELGEVFTVKDQEDMEEDAQSEPDKISFAAYERACIVRAIKRSRGSKIRAARLLKIGTSTLYRKLTKYKIR